MKIPNRTRAAVHEAAHAVMAIILNRRFSYARLGYWSASGTTHVPRHFALRSGYPRKREVIEPRVMVELAGVCAEQILMGRRTWKRRHVEVKRVHEALTRFTGRTLEDVEAYTTSLLERTRALLNRPENWAAVNALASALLASEVISGSDARTIVKATLARPQAGNDWARRIVAEFGGRFTGAQ